MSNTHEKNSRSGIFPAGMLIRIAACMIDAFVLMLVCIALVVINWLSWPVGRFEVIPIGYNPGWTFFTASVLYFTIFEFVLGDASLGKRAVGIKMFGKGFAELSYSQCATRVAVKSIVLYTICYGVFGNPSYQSHMMAYKILTLPSVIIIAGYCAIAFTKMKQGLHDIASGTIVVYVDGD